RSTPDEAAPRVVDGPAPARPVRRLPPRVRRKGAALPLRPLKNSRRHRQTPTPPLRRHTSRIPHRQLNQCQHSATSKLARRAGEYVHTFSVFLTAKNLSIFPLVKQQLLRNTASRYMFTCSL